MSYPAPSNTAYSHGYSFILKSAMWELLGHPSPLNRNLPCPMSLPCITCIFQPTHAVCISSTTDGHCVCVCVCVCVLEWLHPQNNTVGLQMTRCSSFSTTANRRKGNFGGRNKGVQQGGYRALYHATMLCHKGVVAHLYCAIRYLVAPFVGHKKRPHCGTIGIDRASTTKHRLFFCSPVSRSAAHHMATNPQGANPCLNSSPWLPFEALHTSTIVQHCGVMLFFYTLWIVKNGYNKMCMGIVNNEAKSWKHS